MTEPLITSAPARVLCDCGHSEERRLVKQILGTDKTTCRNCYEESVRQEHYKWVAIEQDGLFNRG